MRKRVIVLATALVLVVLAIGAWGCGYSSGGSSGGLGVVGSGSQQNTGIWVTGVGKLTITPDIAQLSLGVEFQAATVAEAQGQAAQAMSAVMAVLKSDGIADKDIATQGYNIYPVYSYDKTGTQTLVGYLVSNTVAVKVRQIDDTGEVIDGVVAAGGDAIRINSISFSVDQPEKYNEQMRALAMADAEARAKQLASLGHVKLGKATYIAESGGYNPPIYYADSSKGTAPSVPTTPISPGETEFQLSVQVIYAIS